MKTSATSCRMLMLFGLFAISAHTASGQLDVENGFSVDEYVNDVLLGEGVTAFNITYTGGLDQLGQMMDGASSDFAFNQGLVMSTSHAKGIGCSSAVCSDCLGMETTDSSLLALANEVPALIGQEFEVGTVQDVSVLEFDFIASGDSIGFDYIFGSDEYLQWINTSYNDVFGFFLSGPGIDGPYSSPAGFPGGAVNIAGVPGSDPNLPITVSSVNHLLNSEYFVLNIPPDGICINGYTSVFHAGHPVQCGETYHLKLAIADGTDPGVESVVILEQGSFTSEVPVLVTDDFEVGTDGADQVFEGCGTVNWTFERPADVPVDEPYSVLFNFDAGEAENGVDFGQLMPDGSVQPFADTLSFAAGEEAIHLTLIAQADGLDEGSESLVVVITSLVSCTDGLMYLTYTLEDGPDPIVIDPINSVVCGGLQILVEPEVTGGFGNYSYDWECSNSENASIAVLVDENWSCMLTVTDTCGLDTAYALNTIELLDSIPLQLDLMPDSVDILEGDSVLAWVQIEGGWNPLGAYLTQWFVNDSLVASGMDTSHVFFPNFYDVLTAQVVDGCNTQVSDTLEVTPLYDVQAVITVLDSSAVGPDTLAFYGCESNELFFSPSASTSTSGEVLYYAWDWGDGELEYTFADTVAHAWNEPGIYQVQLYMADPYESFDVSEPFTVTVYPQPTLSLWADSPICVGGMGEAEVTVSPAPLSQTVYYAGGAEQLSDSMNQTYLFPIEVTGFSDTATLADCQDLVRIRAELEHAHVGALDMWVTCPDGSQLTLLSNHVDSVDACNGGADVDDAYLGEPVVALDNDSAGVGMHYGWSPFGASVLDDANNLLFNGTTIGAGTYAPCDDWCALEGCPINGEWTLHIATVDSLGDGHFFGWNVQFEHAELDSLGLGNPGVLDPELSAYDWNTLLDVATINEDSASFTATYETDEVGSYFISFTGVDQFGCATTRYKAIVVNDGLGFTVDGGSNPNACADVRPLTAQLVNNSYTNCPGMPFSSSWCVGNNVDTVFTVCPMIQGDGTQMNLMFDFAELDSIGDYVVVHDGPDTSYPVLGTYSGDLSNMEWGATDASGCLSFHVMTNDSLSCGDGTFSPMSFTIDCNPFFLDVVWSWEPAEYVLDSTAQNTEALPDSPVMQYVVKAYYEGQESCFSSDTLKVVTQLSAEWLAFQPDCDVSNGTLVIDIDAPGVQEQIWTVDMVIQDSTGVAYTDTVGDSPFAFTFLPVGLYAVDISNDNCNVGAEIALDVAEDGLSCGCTYAIFDNYDPLAVLDDGSCGFDEPGPIQGCTDPAACNYHPGATEDNGSCEYPEPGTDCPEPEGPDYTSWCEENYENPCPEDLTGDGAITIADLLQVISRYSESCE